MDSSTSSAFSSPAGTSSKAGSTSLEASTSAEVALPESEGFRRFWSYSSALSINLLFTPASLLALSNCGTRNDRIYDDAYFPATLTLTHDGKSETYDDVGVRMKGNTSRRSVYSSNGTITQSCHFKVSFKATFDDALYNESVLLPFKHDWTGKENERSLRKKRTLEGMEKIDLKYLPRNLYEGNACYSQEIYCYDRFRQAGIMAPHAKWAALNLSDGVSSAQFSYEAVEVIDKVFLKRHFSKEDAQGDLYKCVYSWLGKADLTRENAVAKTLDARGYSIGSRVAQGKIGVEDNLKGYHPSYQLSTNDDQGEASDFSTMVSYLNAVWNLRYAKAPQSLLEEKLDVASFLKFEAVSYLFGNYDDQRYNYNNYYLYFVPSTGKAVYLPYDWDWSLGHDCGRGLASLPPFYTQDLDGGSSCENNLYWVTLLTGSSSSPTFSLEAMRQSYLSTISSCLSAGFLDANQYESFLAGLANAEKKETSLVSAYMKKRTAVLASFVSNQ